MRLALQTVQAEIDKNPGEFPGELILQTTQEQLPTLSALLARHKGLISALDLSGSQISANQPERDRDEAQDKPVNVFRDQLQALPHLIHLDLSNCNLSSIDLAAIIRGIPHSLRRLSLANVFSDVPVRRALVDWIGDAKELRELNLRNTLNNEVDLQAVLNALLKPGLPLRRLDIREIKIEQIGTVQLLQVLVEQQASLIELQLDDHQVRCIHQWESAMRLDAAKRWSALEETMANRAQDYMAKVTDLALTTTLSDEAKRCLDHDNHKWLAMLIHMKGSMETTSEPMARMSYQQLALRQLYESERSLLLKHQRVIAAHLSSIDKSNPVLFSERERDDLQLESYKDDAVCLLNSESSASNGRSSLASLLRQLLTQFDREADEGFACASKDEVVPFYDLLAESLQQWFDEEVHRRTETIREQMGRISTAPVMEADQETWQRISTPALEESVSAQLTEKVVAHLRLLSSYTDQTMTVADLCHEFQQMKERIIELDDLVDDMVSRSTPLTEGQSAIATHSSILQRSLNAGFVTGSLPAHYKECYEDVKPLLLKAESGIYTKRDSDVLMKYEARISGTPVSENRIEYLSPSLLLQEAYGRRKIGCMRVLLDAGADIFYVDNNAPSRHRSTSAMCVFDQALSEKGKPTKCAELVLNIVYKKWDRLFRRYQESSLDELKKNLNRLKRHLDRYLKTIKSRHYSSATRRFLARISVIGMPHKGEVRDYYKNLSGVTEHKDIVMTLDLLSAIYEFSQEAMSHWKNNSSFHAKVGGVALKTIELLRNEEQREIYEKWIKRVGRGEELSVDHADLMGLVITALTKDLKKETNEFSVQSYAENIERLQAQVRRQGEAGERDRARADAEAAARAGEAARADAEAARADAEAAARAALEVEIRQLKARLAQTSQQSPHPDNDAAPIDAGNPSGDQRRILVSHIDDLKQQLRGLPEGAQAFGTASGFAGMNLETASIGELQAYVQMLESQLNSAAARMATSALPIAGNPQGLYGGVESEEEQEEAYEEEQEAGEYDYLLQRRFGSAP